MQVEDIIQFQGINDYSLDQIQFIIDQFYLNTISNKLKAQISQILQISSFQIAKDFVHLLYNQELTYEYYFYLSELNFDFVDINNQFLIKSLNDEQKQQIGINLLYNLNSYASFYLIQLHTIDQAEKAFKIIELIYQQKESIIQIINLTNLIEQFNKQKNFSIHSELFNKCIEERLIYQINEN